MATIGVSSVVPGSPGRRIRRAYSQSSRADDLGAPRRPVGSRARSVRIARDRRDSAALRRGALLARRALMPDRRHHLAGEGEHHDLAAVTAAVPGKRPATAALQRRAAGRARELSCEQSYLDSVLAPVQRRAAGDAPAADVHATAAAGIAGPAQPLPFLARIQDAFGAHDVRHVQAHRDEAAAGAARAIGATAYATGDHVAFAGEPDLHTAAHEAAHVVQQRAGVHLRGGVGEAGDPYERHADAVADAVVRGEPAEALLGEVAGAPRAATGGVQRLVQRDAGGAGPSHGPAPAAASGSTEARDLGVRIAALAARATAEATDVNVDRGYEATTGRTVATLTDIIGELGRMAPSFAKLSPEEKQALAGKLTGLVRQCGGLAYNRPAAQGVLVMVRTIVETMIGKAIKLAPAADDAPERDSDPAEALAVVRAALGEAADSVAAAKAASKQWGHPAAGGAGDAAVGGALGRLATARQVLRRGPIGSEDQDESERRDLQPLVQRVTEDARVLRSRFPHGPQVRELLVRISDVRDAIYLDRVIAEDMHALVAEQVAADRGLTPEQASRFHEAAELWKLALAAQFGYQKTAVGEVADEARLEDKPKPPPLWLTLVRTAVQMATGGVAKLVIGKAADAVQAWAGGGEGGGGAGGGAGEEGPSFKGMVVAAVEKTAEHLIDVGLEHAAEEKELLGGARATDPSTGAGGAASTDGKIAFFRAQEQALNRAAVQSVSEAIVQIARLEQHPATRKDPEGAIAGLADLAHRALASQEAIAQQQRLHTRAQYATYLVGETTLDDSLEVGIDYGWGPARLEHSHDVAGMVSVEFTGGAPAEPVKVTAARMKGVNQALRDQIPYMTLAAVKVPMRGLGWVTVPGGGTQLASVVSDQGGHRGEGAGGDGAYGAVTRGADDWLVEKGGGRVEADDDARRAARERAAAKILDVEIGGKPLAEQGVEQVEG
ncbi:MAG TPA: DUF4157 domain-containing protein [Kofleriaceae bacterium]|nr:DUF4157 domain-containing protein [Kofleriaceae bacterium]